MAITKVTNRVLDDSSVGVAQLSAGAVPTKLGSEIGALNFRNKIINGNFDIWQRGTSFTNPANLAYLADRWTLSHSAGTRVISQQPFFGQTDPPGNPIYFLRWQQTTSSATAHTLAQKIESVQTLANKQITLSFYAKANSSINVSVNCIQYFGSGGSPIASAGTSAINVTNTWQKYTVNFTTSPLTGKVLGTNDSLDIVFSLPTGSTFTFDIAQVQLEEGPVATPFEQRPIGLELSLCQRYYEKSYDINTAIGTPRGTLPGGNGGYQALYVNDTISTNIGFGAISPYKVPKRAIPTVNIYSYVLGTLGRISNHREAGQPDRLAAAVNIGTNAFDIWNTGTALTNPIPVFHWTAEAEL